MKIRKLFLSVYDFTVKYDDAISIWCLVVLMIINLLIFFLGGVPHE